MRTRLQLGRGLLAFALAASLVALPTAASAHNNLVGTDPSDGADAAAVTEVSLEFAEQVLDIGGSIKVVSNDGVDHAVGDPEVRRKRFIVQQVGVLPAGEYKVSWRIVGEDGHPIKGTFTFAVPATVTVTATAPAPRESPQETATPPPAQNPPAGSSPGLAGDDAGGGFPLGWRGILVPAAIGAVLLLRILLPRLRR